MLQIIYKIQSDNLRDGKLSELLIEKFQTGDISPDEMDKINKWGEEFNSNCPDLLEESLIYIVRNSTSYSYQNHISETSLLYTWPLFFKKFPNGQIWLVEISKRWSNEISSGQELLAKKYGIDFEPFVHPQSDNGITVDSFPNASFDFLSYGIYPIILFDHIPTIFGLTFIYIPDNIFKYSQMKGGNRLYQHILWSFHHIFDDQWTFDGSRGPKSAVNPTIINPINNLEYFNWFIGKINERMNDIMDISDSCTREKLGMTINRAIYDALLSVTSELPYMSKLFFFSCLDKLANLMIQLKLDEKETEAWKLLVNEQFLNTKVSGYLEKIPDNVGDHINWILSHVLEEMKLGDLSPKDLRDIRNSHHGYELNHQTIKRLMSKSGEINNDITLIVVPLILFFFSIKWKVE